MGVAGLAGAVLATAAFPFLFLFARIFGAAGDRFQRILIAYGLFVVAAFVVGLVGLANTPVRSIVRSRLAAVSAMAVVVVVVWAMFGIDSTRPVRALTEAELSYPRAVETRRWSERAEGGFLDAIPRAKLTRAFTTTDPYSAVEAFYATELGKRGWTGPFHFATTGDDRFVDWRRDDFTFQIRFPTKNPTSGPFSVTIYGPRQ